MQIIFSSLFRNFSDIFIEFPKKNSLYFISVFSQLLFFFFLKFLDIFLNLAQNCSAAFLCRLYTLAECIWRESRARVARDWASATLYTRAESSQFWHATQCDSQARYKTLSLVLTDHQKSETLMRQDTSAEATREDPRRGECSHLQFRSRVPSARVYSRECTAGIIIFRNV